jgi:fibronectin type 3 domain-containing protein
MVVYTTCYDEDLPADIRGLKIEKMQENGRERALLTWEPNTEKDFCYYRIYRSEKPDVEISPRREIGTTIANSFKDISVHNLPEYYYHVVAVDQSGNASK